MVAERDTIHGPAHKKKMVAIHGCGELAPNKSLQRKFETQLVRVNDLLCYYLFSDAEVEARLNDIGGSETTTYTTETFPTNPYSERLHIKTSALGKFREFAFHTSVGISLISAVEYLLGYITEAEEFRALVLPTAQDQLKNDKAEEQLSLKLRAWVGADKLDGEIVKTIKYLRLRRNHIAHVRDEMTQDFRDLVKNEAHLLNRYWASQPTEVYEFDFSNLDYSTFSSNEALALVNLTRVCLKKVDALIMASISPLDIARFEVAGFLASPNIKQISQDRQSRKFGAFLKQKYGTDVECSDAEFRLIAGYA